MCRRAAPHLCRRSCRLLSDTHVRAWRTYVHIDIPWTQISAHIFAAVHGCIQDDRKFRSHSRGLHLRKRSLGRVGPVAFSSPPQNCPYGDIKRDRARPRAYRRYLSRDTSQPFFFRSGRLFILPTRFARGLRFQRTRYVTIRRSLILPWYNGRYVCPQRPVQLALASLASPCYSVINIRKYCNVVTTHSAVQSSPELNFSERSIGSVEA